MSDTLPLTIVFKNKNLFLSFETKEYWSITIFRISEHYQHLTYARQALRFLIQGMNHHIADCY